MHDWVTQVGAGGAFVLITLKLVLDWLKIKRQGNGDNTQDVEEMGKRLMSIENRMGTSESGLSRTVAIMEQVSTRLDRIQDQISELDRRAWERKHQ